MSEPVRLLQLPTYPDDRGTLTVAEGLPFEVARAFWLYDCKAPRGGHAHKSCWQAFVCFRRAAISVDGELYLPSPFEQTLVVPPGKVVDVMLPLGSAVLVLCSEKYDREDYEPGR